MNVLFLVFIISNGSEFIKKRFNTKYQTKFEPQLMNSCKTFPGADINLPKEWMGEENGNEELEKNIIKGIHILKLVMIENFLSQGKGVWST